MNDNELEIGDRVRHRRIGLEGTVMAFDLHDTVQVAWDSEDPYCPSHDASPRRELLIKISGSSRRRRAAAR
jgi:hypothetical protein